MTNKPKSRQPWSDDSRQSTDIAGRAEFARAVAARIDSCVDGQGSTVFGLVGPWGSGKSTLLGEIVGQLPTWETVWFSPWSVSDVGSLTAEFVSALAEAFPPSSQVKNKLESYSRFGTPVLKMIPIVGEAISSITTEAISQATKRPAWHSEFGKLSEEIAAQHKRVLVVVDDVDRLDSHELRSLLRVVRLLGRFKNVHYLMAYDQATIDAVLGSTGANDASSEFMEKIVQYPFEVPPAPTVVRRRWSRAILDTVSLSNYTIAAEHVEHHEALVGILASGLETPRAAERLREQIQSLVGLVEDAEVNALDFVALTWLRISHHRVWNHIRLNSNDFLSWREGDSRETRQQRMDQIASLVGRGHAKPVQDAVSYLFEPMGIAGALAGRQARMQNPRFFDRYFQIGLAEDDVSERRTQNALNELIEDISDGPETAALKEILLGNDEERAVLALEVVVNLRRHSVKTSRSIFNYVEDVRSALRNSESQRLVGLSAVERWLAHELFLALKTNFFSSKDLIDRFGYDLLIASAYTIKRSLRQDGGEIKRVYANVARHWIAEVRNESLGETVARRELLYMTSFCIWAADMSDHKGFLSDRIIDGETLIEAATGFVYLNEWVGSNVTYDVTFRVEEFRFAAFGAVARSWLDDVPDVEDVPEYEVSDRSSRILTTEQRRDFAIRSLRTLNLGEVSGEKAPDGGEG